MYELHWQQMGSIPMEWRLPHTLAAPYPPGFMFQRHNIFLSLIIPGYSGDNMCVYMEPLVDDLLRAWEEHVWTYD